MNLKYLAIALTTLGLLQPVYCQSSPPLDKAGSTAFQVVKTARLMLLKSGTTATNRLISGHLYRIALVGEQRLVAEVNDKGELDQAYTCTAGDRLLAEPSGSFYTGSQQSKPCKDAVEFQYLPAQLAFFKPNVDIDRTSMGTYLSAYSDMASIYAQAAGRTTGREKADYVLKSKVSEHAVISATAKALGDSKLDQLVIRDPSQDYRLVFNANGVAKLKSLQRNNNLPETGKLDFATQGLIGKAIEMGQQKGTVGIVSLPTEWMSDQAILSSTKKSASLQAITTKASLGAQDREKLN